MNKDNGGPAFPLVYDVPPENVRNVYQGMTLRDYFAAKALQAFCSTEGAEKELPDDLAAAAYEQADAMLEARKI